MKRLNGLRWHERYNEHMGCTKGCLDYLGIDVSFPWLYGGTGSAFVLNMNRTAFVDAALAWDTSMLYDLAPNVGYTVERFEVSHAVAVEMPDDRFLRKQREAFDFVRARIDAGLPCYAWELANVPAYYVINGYDEKGYTYSGWESGTETICPWDRLGTFDVKHLSVTCIRPAKPASDLETVREALRTVAERIERPDGWALSADFRTGLPAYEMWAEALESGRAVYDGEAYLNVVWREAREMAAEFLREARMRLPGVADAAFDDAIGHYTVVYDKLHALSEMHPERPNAWDWVSTFESPEGAALVREAAEAEREGVVCLRRIAEAL